MFQDELIRERSLSNSMEISPHPRNKISNPEDQDQNEHHKMISYDQELRGKSLIKFHYLNQAIQSVKLSILL